MKIWTILVIIWILLFVVAIVTVEYTHNPTLTGPLVASGHVNYIFTVKFKKHYGKSRVKIA